MTPAKNGLCDVAGERRTSWAARRRGAAAKGTARPLGQRGRIPGLAPLGEHGPTRGLPPLGARGRTHGPPPLGALLALALTLTQGGCVVEFSAFDGPSDGAPPGADASPSTADATRDGPVGPPGDGGPVDPRDGRPSDARPSDARPLDGSPDAAPPRDARPADARPSDAACVPAEEACNGEDDDCDGQIDESDPAVGRPCVVADLRGECAEGITACVGGRLDCQPARQPAPETCDGEDDDCDGQIDEDLLDDGRVCDTGFPMPCHFGAQRCTGGRLVCTVAGAADVEACGADNRDEDCDGLVDEGCGCGRPGTEHECGSDQGLCQRGRQVCVDGFWTACQGGVGPVPEACNGEDDDCDGATDEDWPELGTPCRIEQRPCPVAGVVACNPAGPAPTRCESIEDDDDDEGEGPNDGCGCPPPDRDEVRLCPNAAPPTCTYGFQAGNDGGFRSCDEVCGGLGGECDQAFTGAVCVDAVGIAAPCDQRATPLHCICRF